MTLRNYRNQIDRLIRGESDLGYMLNGSEAHASIIVERMFAHAETEMRVLTRRLDPAIYADDDVIRQAESFASDPKTVTRFIVEDISDSSLAIHEMKRLADALPNIEIKRLPESIARDLKFNFTLMDSKGYRFEDDKTKVNALVRFDDPDFVHDASVYFDSLWNVSENIMQGASN